MLKAAGVETMKLNPVNPTRAMAVAIGILKAISARKASMPIKPIVSDVIC
jgi:hypothetical protein